MTRRAALGATIELLVASDIVAATALAAAVAPEQVGGEVVGIRWVSAVLA